MQIDVEHVAKLARLGLTAEEKKLFGSQLSAILDYANILKKLKTDNVAPTAHAIPLENVLREDKAAACDQIEAIMANAPEAEDHMFKVPKIME